MNKKELRKSLREKREKLDIEELKIKSLALNKKIIELEEFRNAETIFTYISFNREIDTSYLINFCLENKKILCVPVIKDEKTMRPCRINDTGNLVRNKYNIPEPEDIIEISKDKIDFTVVPALGYNNNGYRIGYGRGYYDTFLKDYRGISVGMVLREFLIPSFIPEKFDQPVNRLIIL